MIKFIKSLFYSKVKKDSLKLRMNKGGYKEYRLQTNGNSSTYLCHKIDGFEDMWLDLQIKLNKSLSTLENFISLYRPTMSSEGRYWKAASIRKEMKNICLEKRYLSLADFLEIFIKHVENEAE